MSSARERTLVHVQALLAVASVAGCKKTEPAKPEQADAATVAIGQEPDASVAEKPVVAEAPDASTLVAPSTADSAQFLDAGSRTAKAKDGGTPNWRPHPKPTGYAVVDPMPMPTRLPPTPKMDGGL